MVVAVAMAVVVAAGAAPACLDGDPSTRPPARGGASRVRAIRRWPRRPRRDASQEARPLLPRPRCAGVWPWVGGGGREASAPPRSRSPVGSAKERVGAAGWEGVGREGKGGAGRGRGEGGRRLRAVGCRRHAATWAGGGQADRCRAGQVLVVLRRPAQSAAWQPPITSPSPPPFTALCTPGRGWAGEHRGGRRSGGATTLTAIHSHPLDPPLPQRRRQRRRPRPRQWRQQRATAAAAHGPGNGHCPSCRSGHHPPPATPTPLLPPKQPRLRRRRSRCRGPCAVWHVTVHPSPPPLPPPPPTASSPPLPLPPPSFLPHIWKPLSPSARTPPPPLCVRDRRHKRGRGCGHHRRTPG